MSGSFFTEIVGEETFKEILFNERKQLEEIKARIRACKKMSPIGPSVALNEIFELKKVDHYGCVVYKGELYYLNKKWLKNNRFHVKVVKTDTLWGEVVSETFIYWP